jgi:hypothetical protein
MAQGEDYHAPRAATTRPRQWCSWHTSKLLFFSELGHQLLSRFISNRTVHADMHPIYALAAVESDAQPLSDANPLIRRLVEDRIRKLEAESVESLEGQLRRLLRMLVLTGRCSLESAGNPSSWSRPRLLDD